jgi:uncharacterized membrane protein YraQ (UPF0718 family)
LERLATIWAIFQGLLLEALPFLLIGVLIAGAARWIAPGGRWLQRLPSHPLLAPLSGAALGFALPACECGNVPVARRLLAGGAPLGAALGFLFAAPVLNPIVLASTWAAFPNQPWLLAARPLAALLLAVALSTLLQQKINPKRLVPTTLDQAVLTKTRVAYLTTSAILETETLIKTTEPPAMT